MHPTPIPRDRPTSAPMIRLETAAEDPLATLFHDHYGGLVRLVSGLLDDNESCEEVVQDAFAAMANGSARPEPGKEAAYLRSAALNGARSQLRKRRVRRRQPAPALQLVNPAEHDAVIRVENQEILHVVRELPDRQREVLLLRYQADLSESEIAETLGISAGSVKTHASRGLAAVRDRLQETS